jgi:hypothetical protein
MFEGTSPSSKVSILFGVDYRPGSKPSTFLLSRCGWGMRRKTASNHEGGPPAGTYHRDLETTTSPSIRIHNLQENICTIVPKL